MTSPRCAACPRVDPCPATPRLCQLVAAGRADYRNLVLGMSQDGEAAEASPIAADPAAAAGRALWAELHRRALAYRGDAAAERAWLEDFARRVPCGACRASWTQIVAADPPDLSGPAGYFAWSVRVHNAVNRTLGKPEVGPEEARRIWGRPSGASS